MGKLLVVCGGQRNGSTVLLEGLEAGGPVLNCSEIFHPKGIDPGRAAYELRLKPELNYFSFLRENPSYLSAPIHTVADNREIFDRYLDLIDDAAHGAWAGLNIKFGSWHLLNPASHSIAKAPLLIDILKKKGAAFVILKRRDLVAQVLSEYRAKESGAWHAVTGQPKSDSGQAIVVNAQQIVARCRRLILETEMLEAWLRGDDQHVITYEDVFSDNVFNADAIRRFAEKVGISRIRLSQELPLRRLSTANFGWITNANEVVSAFSKAEFFVDSEALEVLAAR